jgi:cyclopropane-fatty-acyl-phospholipid synthase
MTEMRELALPKGGLAAFVLRRLLAGRLAEGSLVITTPNGVRVANPGAGPGPAAEVVLHRWRALRRLALRGDLGLAEAYIDGDWDSPDLAALLELGARNIAVADAHSDGVWLFGAVRKLWHRLQANTKRGSRRNIEAHYDLGNAFYAAWLDDDMTYSSGIFAGPETSLEQAQAAKQDRVIDLLKLRGGEHILEIGCGWGALARRLAVETKTKVTGITLSPSQAKIAEAKLAGLPAEIRLQDYRDMQSTFDRIVSIEMLEAVGAAYWPAYFERLSACLAPGGRAVLQVISIAEDRFDMYLRRPDFIQLHIFPGGMLPTVEIMGREIAKAGLKLESLERFGESYAQTLATWAHRFEDAWEILRHQGFDERFRRKWRYYLKYCEAGFRAQSIDVGLYAVVKP